MAFTQVDLTITSNGVTTDLHDQVNYLWLDADGIGMAPVRRLTQKGPMQDGVTDLGYRLDPRHVTLQTADAHAAETHFRTDQQAVGTVVEIEEDIAGFLEELARAEKHQRGTAEKQSD